MKFAGSLTLSSILLLTSFVCGAADTANISIWFASFLGATLGSALGAGLSSPKILFLNVLNSNSSSRGSKSARLGGVANNFSSSYSIGTSHKIRARCFDKIPCSLKLIKFSCNFPFKRSVFSNKFSKDSNSSNSFCAVFSPIPGIPGILSTASPIRPSMSMTWSTFFIFQRAQTSLGPKTSTPFPMKAGLYILIRSSTN